MMLSNGVIIFSKSVLVERKLEEAAEDVYAYAFNNLRDSFQSNSLEVIAPIHFLVNTEQLKVTVPKAGDKKQLLELSFKNATAFKDELKKKNTLLLKPDSKEEQAEILEELQESLQLATLPLHIECFDNSNFQGSYPVAAMVCFRHGIPAKKDYRHFHIKTVEGINDFASMSEVVYRRYKRLMDEKKPLPDLVIIDGGKGQLNAALQSIEKLGLSGRMTLVGLAKREESIFFPHDSEPLQLPFDSKAHLLIRRIRDEVHRFGITFHRQTRSKGTIKNELSEIQGIGPQTAISLLKAFKSVKHIKTLSEREIAGAIGSAKARLVFDYFNK
jgi:excinuclease ABC subunit C